MPVPDWLAWTSAVASIAGFALSAAVLVVACLWRRMATELLAAVRHRSLAEELGDVQSELAALSDALHQRDTVTARYIAQRAQHRVSTTLARRGASLTADDLSDLNAVRSLLVRLQRGLSGAGDVGPGGLLEATSRARRCQSLLAAVLGHVQSSVDLSLEKER